MGLIRGRRFHWQIVGFCMGLAVTLVVAVDPALAKKTRPFDPSNSEKSAKPGKAESANTQAAAPAPIKAAAPSGKDVLVRADDGKTVYDSAANVTWLADGNLAASETFGVKGINKSGSMPFRLAAEFVRRMNASNNGAGYLGHNTWTLPATPSLDANCTSKNVNNFGYNCLKSAMGRLYYQGLGLRQPNTAVPMPETAAGSFKNIQPYLYWTASPSNQRSKQNVNGFSTFSFNTGWSGSNVSKHFIYAWPMVPGKLPGAPAAAGDDLQPGVDGQTVYDPVSNVTWLANANLAAKETFGVTGINPDGAMEHTTALAWIKAMNAANRGAGYLGQKKWQLPVAPDADAMCSAKWGGYDCVGDPVGADPFGELFYKQLGLRAGDSAVKVPDLKVGPFHNIQPYLYWSCQGPAGKVTCDDAEQPAPGFEWSFSFGNGFQGTDVLANSLYVMVYYPGPAAK
ncbi:hypothetical protein BH10PSE9_BH10PSE9_21710 [soil metagenome]